MVAFIALELQQEVKEKIYRYVRQVIKPLCREGRWVDSANYHLTLKYIGPVEERQVDVLYRLLNEAASRYGGFRLDTGRVGVFGEAGAGRARVLWLDTTGDVLLTRNPGEMEKLQQVSLNATSVSLMESRLEGKKRVYIPLSVHRLG